MAPRRYLSDNPLKQKIYTNKLGASAQRAYG
jgi:hypothetical protein